MTAASVLLTVGGCSGIKDDDLGSGGPRGGRNDLPAKVDKADQDGGRPPVGHIEYQPPLLPFSITVTSSGRVSLGVSHQLVTPLGTLRLQLATTVSEPAVPITADGAPLPAPPADVTELLICQEGADGQVCEGFTILTGRRLKVHVVGESTDHIESDRIIKVVEPGSRIEVSDEGPPAETGPPGPARIDIEELTFHEKSAHAEFDLERSQSGRRADLSYNHITGDLALVNGARIARVSTHNEKEKWFWSGQLEAADLPGENDCLRAEGWREGFTEDDFAGELTLACVKTAEGDFGYVVINRMEDRRPTAYRIYSHTWVR